jgi:hypothetical protein
MVGIPNRNTKVTGFSLSPELFNRLETQRGDVSRSRFLTNILEKVLAK